ncbi:MAG: ABC transporter ATP-binding protein [Lautropia sp.]|nr:ABC transporter ATP-binding protein [Lautropia sp.]
MSTIQLKNVSRQWGSRYAVHDVSFSAAAGSFVVLLGPSGCGKSTTLRLIAGLDVPLTGRILIGGVDVTTLPPARRRIGMVFQSYALFPHLNVAQNILFGVKVRKEPAAQHAPRLARVAELLGLEGLLDRKPGQLSGGQQQRVALGRAIIAEQPVCLMDEPLSNLDAQLRQEMRREIRALQRKLGVTMIYVTHDQTEAMSMADQVILMREGSIEQDAAPEVLYARPATAFAARFIGTPPMNVLRLAAGPGGAVIEGTDGEAVRAAPDAAAAAVVYPGDAAGASLGLRPEHIQLSTGRFTIDPAAEAAIAATIQTCEYFGSDTILGCLAGDQPVAVRAAGRHSLEPGTPVVLKWSRTDQHFFDAAGVAKAAIV